MLWRPAGDNLLSTMQCHKERIVNQHKDMLMKLKKTGKLFEARSKKKSYKTVKQDNRRFRVSAKIVKNSIKAEG